MLPENLNLSMLIKIIQRIQNHNPMKAKTFKNYHIPQENIEEFINHSESKDITIDIFLESMQEFLGRLYRASSGNYDLDFYDAQVLNVAMDQCPGIFK